MPAYDVTAPDGKTFRVNAPDGATQDDAIAYVQSNFYGPKKVDMPVPEKGIGEKMNDAIGQIPRQIGLTARHGLEGIGDTLDMLSSPFRAGLNAILPAGNKITGSTGKAVADLINLPTPANETERIAGDASRMMASSGGLLGGARLLAKAPGLAGEVGGLLAANPGQQMASSAGAGTAGGYIKETGGNPVAQGVAALAGGLAAPAAVNTLRGVPQAARSVAEFIAPGIAASQRNPQIDVLISNALKPSGLTIDDISGSVRGQLRDDVAKAFNTGNLNDAALRRLVDYRLTGATPRRGNLTLDPGDISREKNMAKFGINSADPKLQQLGQVENANNQALIGGLNQLGANTADDALAGAVKVMSRLDALNATKQANIDAAYQAARETTGRSASLDPYTFTQRANDLLDESLLGGKLPGDVRNLLNKAAKGDMPLTVDVAEQFKTRIGDLQRATMDKAERKALGMVRQALDETPLLEGQGQQAIDAFNRARGLNRSWMGIVEQTPALQAVRDGIEPDKFVQTFIIGNGSQASVMDAAKLKNLLVGSPDAMQAVRGQMLAYLKDKALNGATDEVGKVSQSALNKAIDSIGERKLRLFFDPQELAQLKAIARVASYEQVQPIGAAVNNSNTAGAALATMFDKVANSPLLGKLPLAPQVAGNISASISARNALNTPNALLSPKQVEVNGLAPYLLPALAGSGLLTR